MTPFYLLRDTRIGQRQIYRNVEVVEYCFMSLLTVLCLALE